MRYVLTLVFSVVLIGCLDEEDNPLSVLTSDRDKLLETWYISADDISAVAGKDESLQGLESYEITYNDDGTFLQKVTVLVGGVSLPSEHSGAWTLDGSTLTQTYEESLLFKDGVYEFSAIITDVVLTLTRSSDGLVIPLRKKDS